MPAHSKKSSRHHRIRSMRRMKKKHAPTIKRNRWRVLSHTAPTWSRQPTHRTVHRSIPHSRRFSRGKHTTLRNIHRSIEHMIPHNMNTAEEDEKEEMPNAPQRRHLPRRAAQQQARNRAMAQRMEEEARRANREARRNQRSAHASSMAELNAMMGKLGI